MYTYIYIFVNFYTNIVRLFLAAVCKKTWTNLRDSFRRALKKKRETKSGQAASKIKKWKFEDEMSFLLPFMQERETCTNLKDVSDDDNEHEPNENVYNDTNNDREMFEMTEEMIGTMTEEMMETMIEKIIKMMIRMMANMTILIRNYMPKMKKKETKKIIENLSLQIKQRHLKIGAKHNQKRHQQY